MEIRKVLDLMYIYNVICLFKIVYVDVVWSKCGIYYGMDVRVIYIYKVRNKIFLENIICLECVFK